MSKGSLDALSSFLGSRPRAAFVWWPVFTLLLFLSLFVLLLTGCSDPGPELVPVRGELYVDAEPAAGAMVILNPASGYQREDWPAGLPHARVNDDGSFQFNSPPFGEGVPPGQYKLTAIWEAAAPGSDPNDPEPATIDRLQGRYAKPDKSTNTAEVQAPETNLGRINLE